jgi:hypothetical protein
MLAPRISYLPLLLPTLQAQLVEPACAALALPVPPASDYYFSDSRGALKWCASRACPSLAAADSIPGIIH